MCTPITGCCTNHPHLKHCNVYMWKLCVYKIHINFLNLKKEVGVTIKSKGTSSQLKAVRNSHKTIIHQLVTLSSNMYPNACTK